MSSTFKTFSWESLLNTSFEELQTILPSLFEGVLPEYLILTADTLFQKINAIHRLGLGYLSCGREGFSLSSGELKRLRLSSIATGYLN